jgi:hypothetical protein
MKEYDPPVFPLRWMKYGGLLFLSGVTDMTHPTFEEQFPPSSSASPARSPTAAQRGTTSKERHSCCITKNRLQRCA